MSIRKTYYLASLHGDDSLQEQGSEGNRINACVMLRNIHNDLKKQGGEGYARSKAEIGQDGENGDDGENDRASCRIILVTRQQQRTRKGEN